MVVKTKIVQEHNNKSVANPFIFYISKDMVELENKDASVFFKNDINIEIKQEVITNKQRILSDLVEMLEDEKKCNNLEPNKLSLQQFKKLVSLYDNDFKFLPRVILYPTTKDIGLSWKPTKNSSINLFCLKNKNILYLIDYIDTNESKRGVILSNETNFKETIELIEKEIKKSKM
ncbi:MAG: hypothetical protein Ta2D_04130 [Rickettsiales bacterium]|nr:MAG: hypothetical protein Ta2D_04130 [Rickettsiales bacterium]